MTIYENENQNINEQENENLELPYVVRVNDSFEELTYLLKNLMVQNKKILILTDNIVKKLYYNEVEAIITDELNCEVYLYSIGVGEKNKSIYTCDKIYNFLIENNFSRNDIIIALGGGVVSDVGGYVAATYMRGIDFGIIPTSLLSMCDASIGSKTAVDVANVKNAVGAFKNPLFVYDNISVVKSLNDKVFASGLAEVIKLALIDDATFYKYIEDNKSKIAQRNPETLKYVIAKCINIKKKYCLVDPYDNKERKLLNFGHTMGHAIESIEGLTKTHGECVAIGIRMALEISAFEETDRIVRLFNYFGLDTDYAIKNQEKILKFIKNDKKCVKDKIDFVYLHDIGEAYVKEIGV